MCDMKFTCLSSFVLFLQINYEFGFRKREDTHSGYDAHVKDALIAIIEQFFAENANVLLYICDTSDGREEKRNRLFVRWFEEFATPNRFTMETANATVDGQGFYAAIIVENTNPMLVAIVSDFKQTAESLTGEKPQTLFYYSETGDRYETSDRYLVRVPERYV